MGEIDAATGDDSGAAAPAPRPRGVTFKAHSRTQSMDSMPSYGRDVSMLDRPRAHLEDSEKARERRMLTALTYNRHLRETSADVDLLVTNLPSLHLYPSEEQWFTFIEVLTEGLGPVVLARGSRREVITTYV